MSDYDEESCPLSKAPIHAAGGLQQRQRSGRRRLRLLFTIDYVRSSTSKFISMVV
jgi:hypothetical protein